MVSEVCYFSECKHKYIRKKAFVGTDASKTRFKDKVIKRRMDLEEILASVSLCLKAGLTIPDKF